jgi:spore photoproduct lyase
MWTKIFVEENLKDHPRVKNILATFSKSPIDYIESYDQIFQKVKKPYLQKREDLQLFLAEKKGSLVKLAPEAYGVGNEAHYYFIHAYNCIYECQYCYLQGYFQSPDIVLFINHEDIIQEIKQLASANNHPIWFHAGEFSDSLALSHITQEWPLYWQAFKELPHATLELRTKSANTKAIENLEPLPNIIVSFSLSPERAVKDYDLKTAPLKARLTAMKKLIDKGFKVGIHLDPIIATDTVVSDYNHLASEMLSYFAPEAISYISLGVVRFTKDVYQQVQKNYSDSALLGGPFTTSFDNKVRYPRPLRLHLLRSIEQGLVNTGFSKEQIYLCMERE